MSWEEDGNKQYKCPCGAGSYTVRFYSDDWNRYRTEWEMDCPLCKQNYRLYKYCYPHHGIMETSSLWVPKELYEKREKLYEQLSQCQEEVAEISKSRYLNRWISYFNNVKTKKGIWEKLTDNGKTYPSLSTFYAHVRSIKIETYLAREFNYNNMLTILKKLGIEDSEVNERMRAIKEMESELSKTEKMLRKEGYSG